MRENPSLFTEENTRGWQFCQLTSQLAPPPSPARAEEEKILILVCMAFYFYKNKPIRVTAIHSGFILKIRMAAAYSFIEHIRMATAHSFF